MRLLILCSDFLTLIPPLPKFKNSKNSKEIFSPVFNLWWSRSEDAELYLCLFPVIFHETQKKKDKEAWVRSLCFSFLWGGTKTEIEGEHSAFRYTLVPHLLLSFTYRDDLIKEWWFYLKITCLLVTPRCTFYIYVFHFGVDWFPGVITERSFTNTHNQSKSSKNITLLTLL